MSARWFKNFSPIFPLECVPSSFHNPNTEGNEQFYYTYNGSSRPQSKQAQVMCYLSPLMLLPADSSGKVGEGPWHIDASAEEVFLLIENQRAKCSYAPCWLEPINTIDFLYTLISLPYRILLEHVGVATDVSVWAICPFFLVCVRCRYVENDQVKSQRDWTPFIWL